MIDTRTAIEYMRNELLTIAAKKTRGKMVSKEFTIRCPFCGDSKKDPRDEHFYVKMTPDSRDGLALFSYDCKLCKAAKKVMSLKDAQFIGIQNPELLEYIASINKNRQNSIQTSGANILAKKFEYINPFEGANFDVRYKQEYMWKRLHFKDICVNPNKYKVIYDLREFFIKNNLKPNLDYGRGRTPEEKLRSVQEMLNMFHNDCIGFVSFDNTHINFRNIRPNPPQRYSQYMIYPQRMMKKGESLVETSGMYVIPTSVDTMGERLKLVMAEGSFDILRAYSDFYKAYPDKNTIFSSVSNSHGYVPCITKFMEYGLMFDEIEIYSDQDVKLQEYVQFIRPIVPDAIIRVYYNKKAKDIGDIKDPIELSRITI